MTTLGEATSSKHYEVARQLFKSYAQSLDFDLGFQNFGEEIDSLPGCYSPPGGCILLATHESHPVGCAALRPLEPGVCEMKRLYTLPEIRGSGVGRMLAEAIVGRGRELGYRKMRLDTVGSMRAANCLYASLGFRPTEPYCHNPLADASFFELEL